MRRVILITSLMAAALAGTASAKTLHLNLQSPSDGAQHTTGPFHNYTVVCAKLPLPQPGQYRLTVRNMGTEPVPVGARLSFKTDNPHVKITNYVSPLAIPPGEVFGGSQGGNWNFEDSQTYTQCSASAVFP